MTAPTGLNLRIQNALALHRAGRLQEARAAYEGVLAQAPGNVDALHLLGTLMTQLGHPAEAVPLLERAVKRMPKSAPCLSHFADALAAVGRGREAEAAWRKALKLAPRDAEASFNLAGHLAQAGRWRDAEPFARRAAELLPNSLPARYRFALTLEGQGRSADALAQFRAVVRLAPNMRDMHRRVVANAAAAGDMATAWRAAQRCMVLQPEAADGFVAIEAVVLPEIGQDAKGRWMRRAVTAAPGAGFLRAVCAGYRYEAKDYAGALEETRRAILANPETALGYATRARAANILPSYDLAGQATRWGLRLAPGDPELLFQHSQVEKAIGDLALGWALDEHRVRSPRFHLTLALPARWGGPGTPVGRLLVATEQGVGDELLFLSCLPDLLADVPDPVVELDARLHPLFRRSFPGITLVPRQATRLEAGRAVFDYTRVAREHSITHYIHAGSLLGLYRAERARPATRRGYLEADPEAVAAWRERLAGLGPEPKVGVSWRSIAVASATRFSAYAPLDDWAPILRLPGIRFVCLQYDECRAEVEAFRERTGLDLWIPEGLDQMDDLDGTAALMSALDAVVSAPTTVCWLAAAVGAETFRIAQGKFSIAADRDHFFPNMHPLAPAGRPLDLKAAIARAAEVLPSAVLG
ncbi:protein FlbA [Thalassobaculum fulvum]|uniref:Protein FlbA n=1 Tax=Thalassobaculum fulvum TaxID=1633335 RepID=A0A918XX68_9PROT|nr:tetratricopeptide repeat protein [Thalassobaculum fulvum]GHD60905.1 protein FlbA [Thalassobaculum fulvum]